MIFQRKIYSKLLAWKEQSQGKEAILIEGARRIGKSTICEEFAKKNYKSYILIDFARTTDRIKECFNEHLNDFDTFFMILMTEYKTKLYERDSVIIFDEVQNFPRAREAIKYLVADGRYDYIETGSLITIKENVRNIIIPSEEKGLKMYPMDFEEFCWAFGEELLVEYIRKCFMDRVALERGLHNKAKLLFEQYMLVGGMPKSVVAFLENHRDFEKADAQKRLILNLYRNDIMKIKSQYRSKVSSLFENIPGLLSKHEKKVVFNEIQQGTYAEQYRDTFFWLADSMVANICFLCTDPNVGLSLNESRSSVKCYLGDGGLLVSHAFNENEIVENDLYKQILNGKLGINKGMFYENVIAQILVSNGHKLYFYTNYNEEKHRNDIEIDFLISNKSKLKYKVFPIEVKSGKNYSTTSLLRFREKFKNRIGECYIIHTQNYKEKDGIICIPSYMTICL